MIYDIRQFRFGDHRQPTLIYPVFTSGILRSTSVVLPDLENMGITVGISFLSCI